MRPFVELSLRVLAKTSIFQLDFLGISNKDIESLNTPPLLYLISI